MPNKLNTSEIVTALSELAKRTQKHVDDSKAANAAKSQPEPATPSATVSPLARPDLSRSQNNR